MSLRSERDIIIAAVNSNPVTTDEAWKATNGWDDLLAEVAALRADLSVALEASRLYRAELAALRADLTVRAVEQLRQDYDNDADRDALRAGIEEYLLWEPGKRGHAEAHRKLAALAVPSVDATAETCRYCGRPEYGSRAFCAECGAVDGFAASGPAEETPEMYSIAQIARAVKRTGVSPAVVTHNLRAASSVVSAADTGEPA